MTGLRRLRLINPNSDEAVTRSMAALANDTAPARTRIEATTSHRAVRLITNPSELCRAVQLLLCLFDEGLDPLDGVIIAAFGDPAVVELRQRLNVPVIGIAEAAMREAAANGPFAICTITPGLADAMRVKAVELGLDNALVAVHSTSNDPNELIANPRKLDLALTEQVARCKDDDRVRTVIFGGGPMAAAARRMAATSELPIIEPIAAAVRYFSRPAGTTHVEHR